jgi:hypothetical protein
VPLCRVLGLNEERSYESLIRVVKPDSLVAGDRPRYTMASALLAMRYPTLITLRTALFDSECGPIPFST